MLTPVTIAIIWGTPKKVGDALELQGIFELEEWRFSIQRTVNFPWMDSVGHVSANFEQHLGGCAVCQKAVNHLINEVTLELQEVLIEYYKTRRNDGTPQN